MSILPQSQEAELAVIASLLRGDSESFDLCSKLTPAHFVNRSNGLVFTFCSELAKQYKEFDLLKVTEAMRVANVLDEVGGAGLLSQILTKNTFYAGGLESAVEILVSKHRLRTLMELGQELLTRASQVESADELLPDAEAKIFSIASETSIDQNELSVASEQIEDELVKMEQGIKVSGIPTGIQSFDKVFGGLNEGRIYGIGARPSMGKTALGIQIAANLVMREKAVLFITLEMTSERLLERMAAQISGVKYSRYMRRSLSPSEIVEFRKAKNLLKDRPLHLVSPSIATGITLRSMIRKAKRQHDIQLVVLDYIQLADSQGHGEGAERRGIADVSKQLQKAAKETKCSIILLSQLNRETDKQTRPRLSNLKESGQIEQDCDGIVLLWSKVEPSSLQEGEMLPVIFSVEKNRDGARGDQELLFDGPFMTFREKAI